MTTQNLGSEELLVLLRDASLKPESIVEELECAGCSPPLPAQVTAARETLAHLAQEDVARTAGLEVPDLAKQIAALPEGLALAVTHAAGKAGRSEILSTLATSAPKPVAKEAKRELQRLKQKGVQVPELKLQGDAVLKPLPEQEAPSCYASSIDAYGERAVWWARAGRNGVEVVQAVISDIRGILSIDALALSRRSFREFVKRLPRQGVVTTIELHKDHARSLIAQAEAEGTRNGFSPPPSYAQALQLLGPAPQTLPPHPSQAIDLGPDGELPHAMAGAALFADPLFLAWIPEEEALRAFAPKTDEIMSSQLYLDEAQKRAAFERAADDAAAAYFTPQRRTRYANRLAEMAPILAAEHRLDAARTALAVSRVLLRGGESPFCRALFTHALEGRFDPATPAPAQPPSGGLIVP